jgi:hypothetical protein
MSNGQEAEELRNFAGILRPGDSGALDEGRFGSLGRGQQSLSPGRGQAERGSGRRGGDHGEHAELPKDLGPRERKKPAHKPSAKAKKSPAQPDNAADRKAAQAYERERQRREREEAKEEAARQKERERRQQATGKAQTALEKAEQEHTRRAAALRAEIEAIEKKLKAEDADWDEEEGRLKAALRRARD